MALDNRFCCPERERGTVALARKNFKCDGCKASFVLKKWNSDMDIAKIGSVAEK